MVSPRLGCRPNGTGDQTRLASLTLRPVIRQPSPQAPRAIANATGTGSFDSVPTKFKGSTLFNGRFDVKTPGT